MQTNVADSTVPRLSSWGPFMYSVLRSQQQLPARGLALMLLTAIIAAMLVVANSVIDSYTDGHLLAAWIALWATAFTGLAIFADTAARLAASITLSLRDWSQLRRQRLSDANFMALAERDPRIMAELLAAVERAEAARTEIELAHGRAWVRHHPRDTLNASYAGPRRFYVGKPLSALPAHLHMLTH